ncbi:hypothetical protein RSOLAG1IB_05799 [Rhizoctonia solani AG-1 IB]|uniref:Uncharacterized protein n=1 Tax=Thanatephorus cucumeris (strain AG1-IB / isolate 7/3/14) TaxID=1108050 RepID=A0A0B7F6T9_THACB|nr:hypothetical protein RSOLAG1IB_05799 [Rhizoctonia solani AG-1 IB]
MSDRWRFGTIVGTTRKSKISLTTLTLFRKKGKSTFGTGTVTQLNPPPALSPPSSYTKVEQNKSTTTSSFQTESQDQEKKTSSIES